MNVCLQSLLNVPGFYNMMIAISDNKEVMRVLPEDSLLSKFVHLSLYFSPSEQLDKKSPFAAKVIDAENLFYDLNQKYNPFQEH
jgi:hypothetical protein